MMQPELISRAWSEHGAEELLRLEHSIRTPLAVRRKISVASLAGGTGCTRVAMQLVTTLANKRPTPLVFVEVRRHETLIDRRRDIAGIAQFRLDARRPDAVTLWQQTIANAGADRDISITDWGALTFARMRAVALRSHVVCLVSPNERDPLQRAVNMAYTLQQSDNVACVIAAVDLRRPASIASRILASRLPLTSTRIPHDRRARQGADAPLGGRTRVVVGAMRLASQVVEAALASQHSKKAAP